MLQALIRRAVIGLLRLALRNGLVDAVASVTEASTAITLLCLHLLVDQPKRVDVSRDVAEDSQEDVD